MSILKNLEPARVFYYFEEICKIPHISYHEKALSDYCAAFAKDHDLYFEQDEMGNILIIKEAFPGYEAAEPIILQGHLDMVGDKLPNCPIDLEKEPISLRLDGDHIYADSTTLGGDDGIAVAYALAILEADTIAHPRLEVVLTVSEEVGLLGATAMDLSSCKARRLLNIDSEEEGILTAGCAGGRRAFASIPLTFVSGKGLVCEIKVSGLLGGHSGTEINKGRANANALMGRLLLYMKGKLSYSLISLQGGVKENVIPNHSEAHILLEDTALPVLRDTVSSFQALLSQEYAVSDAGIRIECIPEQEKEIPVADASSLEAVLTALNLAPNGVQAMSKDLPDLVETSLNLGVMDINNAKLELCFSIRSSVASAKDCIYQKLEQLTTFLGGRIESSGDYPSWSYNRTSSLRDTCVTVYKEMYGTEPKIDIIHAGLECGILSSKIEGLDCISFGPNLYDIHSPNEHMSISSVERTWKYLLGILAAK